MKRDVVPSTGVPNEVLAPPPPLEMARLGVEDARELIEEAKFYLISRNLFGRGSPHEDAWRNFYEACDPVVRGLARQFGRRGADFEDGVQEVWRVLLVRLPAFHPEPGRGRFRAWLEVVARRALIDHARRNRRFDRVERLEARRADELFGRTGDPAEDLDRRCDIEEVRAAIGRYRLRWPSGPGHEILHLRWIEGRDGAETALALGLTLDQVWAHQNRALKRLASLLGAPPLGRQGGGGKISRISEKVRKLAGRSDVSTSVRTPRDCPEK